MLFTPHSMYEDYFNQPRKKEDNFEDKFHRNSQENSDIPFATADTTNN